MPQLLTIGLCQSPTLSTTAETLAALRKTSLLASKRGVSILLFPEAYLGGYPRTCTFGAAIGTRHPYGRDQFLAYYRAAVDLGDTFKGEGQAWIDRKLPVEQQPSSITTTATITTPTADDHPAPLQRGDGTRESLEQISRETGVFLIVGLVERAGPETGGSLFCSAVYIDPSRGIISKRRKIMPTGTERLVWAQGNPSTLTVVTTRIKGVQVRMGTAICWENFMPLLRYAVYAQGVNLWLAPTADARDTWQCLMRTVACEGRCFVMSCNQAQKMGDLPEWATATAATTTTTTTTTASDETKTKHVNGSTAGTDGEQKETEWATRGGSVIVNPMGEVIQGPAWEKVDELLIAEVDFDDCARGKLDFDAAGHYSRHDAFELKVEGLDLTPPP